MPRERTAPGDHGRIAENVVGKRFVASAYVRDPDGRLRRVERSSAKSAEDARRMLRRHLAERRAPMERGAITSATSLSELFRLWIAEKVEQDGVRPQTADSYRAVWGKHGEIQLGSLRVGELQASYANKELQDLGRPTDADPPGKGRPAQAARLRMVLIGMFDLAIRFDAIRVNPIKSAKTIRHDRKAVRAVTAVELAEVRGAVGDYARRVTKPGPHPGRLLPSFVELLAATGGRPNEVLGLRWSDVRINDDPPTVTIAGTLIDHGRIVGKPLHRQDVRKAGAPPHTVALPRFGVDALLALVCDGDRPDGPVFANRDGGWMSLANMRRSLRAALPEHLTWVTPHSFRRSVATVVRDTHGVEAAQQQLSHAKLATTEAHYLQRRTHGPDTRAALAMVG